MNRCLLADRGLLAVSGQESEAFLNRLVTNSTLGMKSGAARYAALLSPQGKLLFDFLVLKRADDFWIDVARSRAADLASKLTMFKLRAKVVVADLSEELAIGAAWDGALMEAPGIAYRDPRHNDLGYRVVAPREALGAYLADDAAYTSHRIGLGIPQGGVDFAYGDAFAHDANIDLLHGIDFEKGCYVGQEVVSRVHHRGSARKRIVKLTFYGEASKPGAILSAGAVQLGHVTSVVEREGLATVRIDRLEEAEAVNGPILAEETLVGVKLPERSTVSPPNYAEDVF